MKYYYTVIWGSIEASQAEGPFPGTLEMFEHMRENIPSNIDVMDDLVFTLGLNDNGTVESTDILSMNFTEQILGLETLEEE